MSSTQSIWQVLATRDPSPSSDGGIWTRLEATAQTAHYPKVTPGRLAEAIDPGMLRPRLAPDVEAVTFDTRWGTSYTMIRNPRDNLYFRLDGEEGRIAASLDGSRSVAEITAARVETTGELDVRSVVQVVDLLKRNGFLDRPYVDAYKALRGRTTERESRFGRAMRNLFKTQTVHFPGAVKLADAGYRAGGWLMFTWPANVLFVALLVVGPALFVLDIHSRHFEITGYRVARGALILFVLDMLAIMIHESGHALAIRHSGRRILGAGFQLYLGHPAFFIDSADILMAPPRERIRNAWFGPYMSLVVSGGAATIAFAFPHMALANVFFQLAFLNYFGGLLNLIPFLELDGYWILTDAFEFPDLLPRSLAFFRRELFRKLRRRERLTRRERGLTAFACIALVFTVASLITSYFLLGPLMVRFVRSMWRGGWATRALLLALAVVVLGPLVNGLGRASGWVWGWLRYAGHRVRFRSQLRWRVEAGELIDRLPVFEQLDIEDVNALAGRVRLVRATRGTAVVRQGDAADEFFVVRTGELSVVEERPDGTERELRRLRRGESFGEVAILERSVRTATVRALSTAELFGLRRSDFERVLAEGLRRSGIERTVQQIARITALPVFQRLGDGEAKAVAEGGSWVEVEAGRCVVRQAEQADAFYAIESGRFEVLIDGSRMRELGPGGHFGELALLAGSSRTASVCSITPATVFRLERDAFDRILAKRFGTGDVPAVSGREVRTDPDPS